MALRHKTPRFQVLEQTSWASATNPKCFSPLPAEESNKKHPFPCPTSYRTALTYYLDITNPPRTNVLYELAQYASEPSEQEHLRKMASSSGEGKVGLLPLHLGSHHLSPVTWATAPPLTPPQVSPRIWPSPGAVPELGGGGSAAHPGHPAGLPVPAAPHRPPV